MPTRGRFHLKPRHFPLSLSPTRRPPKTPLLNRNESPSVVRQRYGSVFVRAYHLQAKIRLNLTQGADKGAISKKTRHCPLSLTSPSDRPCTCNHFCAERAWLPRGRFMAALDILKAVFRPRRRLILFLKVSASGAALRVAWVAVFPPSTFVTRSRNNNCAKTAILHKQL